MSAVDRKLKRAELLRHLHQNQHQVEVRILQELLALELEAIKDGLVTCSTADVQNLQGQAAFIVRLQQEIDNPPKSVNELRGIKQ